MKTIMKTVVTFGLVTLLGALGFACGTGATNKKCDREYYHSFERADRGNKF